MEKACRVLTVLSIRAAMLKKAERNIMKTWIKYSAKKLPGMKGKRMGNNECKIAYKYKDFTPKEGYSFRDMRVYDTKSGNPTGKAFLIYKNGDALLYDLRVEGKYRHKGYGTALIKVMQSQFDSIITSWYSIMGMKLCKKNGFEVIPGPVPKLVWRKEKDDAGEDKED